MGEASAKFEYLSDALRLLQSEKDQAVRDAAFAGSIPALDKHTQVLLERKDKEIHRLLTEKAEVHRDLTHQNYKMEQVTKDLSSENEELRLLRVDDHNTLDELRQQCEDLSGRFSFLQVSLV